MPGGLDCNEHLICHARGAHAVIAPAARQCANQGQRLGALCFLSIGRMTYLCTSFRSNPSRRRCSSPVSAS